MRSGAATGGPDATHGVHLDRASHGRNRLLDAVTAFLAQPD
jgi:hypothetical protein